MIVPILKGGLKAAWYTAKGAKYLASGGPIRRGILGGTIGAIGGAMQGYEDPNQQTESIAKGAFFGAFAGAAGFRRTASGIPAPAFSRMGTLLGGRFAAKGLKFLGKDIYRTAKDVGSFISNHPQTALGLGAAAAVGLGFLNTSTQQHSPTLNPSLGLRSLRPAFGMSMEGLINPSYTPEAAMNAQQEITGGAGRIGTGYMMPGRALGPNAQAFMDSTAGLNFGLHRGRHG